MSSFNRSGGIIHVDDDPNMLRLIKHQLRSNFHVESLEDPTQCLDTLVRTGSRIVILDIDLGEHNGLDLLREIKQFDGGIHVIMLTGLVSMETILTSMRDGAEACLFKPLRDKYELVDVINDTLKKITRWHESLHDLIDRKREVELSASRYVTP
jgi:DNA-binding NtrC family response regulator